MTIQLIRHGKTQGNFEKRFTGGKTDEPLCQTGVRELEQFVSGKIYETSEEVFVSPMKRCIETAGIIFPEKKSEFIIMEEFKEISFGILENKSHEELDGNPEYQAWIDSNGKGDIPGGEKFKEFGKRVMEGFRKMISMAKTDRIAAVIHGGTIMAILSALQGGDFYDYMPQNGRGYVLELDAETMKILALRKIQ